MRLRVNGFNLLITKSFLFIPAVSDQARTGLSRVVIYNVGIMKLSLDNNEQQYRIDAYTVDSVRVGGRDYGDSLIVTPEKVFPDWQPAPVKELLLEDMEQVISLGLQVLLLGTGRNLQFPPPPLMAGLAARGIGLEVMDTAAACRTYNILAGEGRRVGAALIIR